MLIVKFLSDSLTPEELQELRDWLAIPDNQKVFEGYVKSNQDLLQLLHNGDADETYPKIWNKINEKEKPVRKLSTRVFTYSMAAAILILVLGSVFFIREYLSSKVNPDDLVDTNTSVVLKLGDGKTRVLNLADTLVDVTSNGRVKSHYKSNQLNYYNILSKAKNSGDPEYNTIEVPNGNRFKLVLADSTIVHLNAGTTLKYPVYFRNTGNREVYLQGEAFFEVSKDKEHPFVISSDDLQIEVLGTKFNISSYRDKDLSEVVLVEGSVKMQPNTPDKQHKTGVVLKPGFRGELKSNSETIDVEEVDTYLYTAWMNGKLIFRNKTFNEILETLERHYNVKIINDNQELGKSKFNTSFGSDVKLERILFYFEKMYGISYTIKEDTIIIK
ncbi:FecR family protein [Sinomicrobium sp. M5D2P17]